VLLLALVVLALALAVQGSPWQTDIRRLSTVPQHEFDKDSLIRDQLGAPDVARLLYLVANDQEAVLQRLEAARPDLERLVERGLIDGFDDVSLWLPSAATQRERQRSLPDRQTLANALSAANAQLPFRLARLEAFLDDVEASRGLAPLRAGDLAGSPVGVRVSMLLQPLDGRWLGLVPLSGVNGDAAVASLEDLADRHDLAYLDLREGTAELLSGFFTDALDRMLVVAALIVLTLALALRDPVRVSRILMPIAIALTVTFLLVLRLHGAASLFHLISLLLVVGLAIDYGLFLSRPVSDAADRRRTLLSVSVGAVSSCAMFAMLALSDIPALRAIGSTVAVGTLCAFSASLLLARPREE
jgi:predicted exporter